MLLFQNHFRGESTKSNKRKGMRSLEGFCLTVNQSQKQLCRNYFLKVAVLGTVQPQLLIKALVTGSSFPCIVGQSCVKHPYFFLSQLRILRGKRNKTTLPFKAKYYNVIESNGKNPKISPLLSNNRA